MEDTLRAPRRIDVERGRRELSMFLGERQMRRSLLNCRSLMAALVVAAGASPGAGQDAPDEAKCGVDLTRIDRRIAREPT